MPYPFYTKIRLEKPEKQILPSPLHKQQVNPSGYIPDDGLIGAVNAALLLGQPLLLTGEPGVGKTQLAYSLAWQLDLGKPLRFDTKSTSEARDLFYTYDAMQHFHAIQTNNEKMSAVYYLKLQAFGKAIVLTNPREKIAHLLPLLDIPFTEPRQSVVLIDEIDKAPRDFPNDLLNEIEENSFRIPELELEGYSKIAVNEALHPILVLTSNEEKHLPDAFLRRCVYYNVPFPAPETLQAIIKQRLINVEEVFLNKALNFFETLREEKSLLRKKPATAELLNWLSLLRGEMFAGIDDPLSKVHQEKLVQTLGVLVKNKDDQEKAQECLKTTFDK